MANVFGHAITNLSLAEMEAYDNNEDRAHEADACEKKKITRKDRAYEALKAKNAHNKAKEAERYVESLKEQYGFGVSTLCMVYNATGDAIHHIDDHDYVGHTWKSSYPPIIENGQWGVFLHVRPAAAFFSGSYAAVVYRGKNEAGNDCDWMFAWGTPFIGSNHAFTRIREANHFASNKYWDDISKWVAWAGPTDKDNWNGCSSMVSIGGAASPLLEAILTQETAVASNV
ncbi:hypothetical protein CFOL_v3_13714 [Cephalotus follicularis]|uniref:23 kDa jasmonate-induced protein-like n=1 Tax=Cephalotus follicularis TaxID=3775 RepID=A0A1Q3BQ97_CEPFO|nr:hypothetical protein CFOL_v3_13714 [Cephalotus follicularis]